MVTRNKPKRINDIPLNKLEAEFKDYGRKKSASVASSRRFLRSLGMEIRRDGTIVSGVDESKVGYAG